MSLTTCKTIGKLEQFIILVGVLKLVGRGESKLSVVKWIIMLNCKQKYCWENMWNLSVNYTLIWGPNVFHTKPKSIFILFCERVHCFVKTCEARVNVAMENILMLGFGKQCNKLCNYLEWYLFTGWKKLLPPTAHFESSRIISNH
jgi:hypothetical protein